MNHRDSSLAGGFSLGQVFPAVTFGKRSSLCRVFAPPHPPPSPPLPPAENVQLRRLRPVKPLPPRGWRRLGKPRECLNVRRVLVSCGTHITLLHVDFPLPRSFSVPLRWLPVLATEQGPGAHIQGGGQIADNVPHLAWQESQVGQGDDEEAHVQEVQQLAVRAGLSLTPQTLCLKHCVWFSCLNRGGAASHASWSDRKKLRLCCLVVLESSSLSTFHMSAGGREETHLIQQV